MGRREDLLAELQRRGVDPNQFDPEGVGYDYETAKAFGGKPDTRGHWGSLDPRTGMVLKGKQHPTWDLMIKEEERRGNEIIKRDGRYYSKGQVLFGKRPFAGIVSEPVSPEEAKADLEYEAKRSKLARYEAIDPHWQTLETPEIAQQIDTEDLLDIMSRPTIPSLEETKRLFGVKTFGEIGGAFEQVGVKRRAYEELIQRDFTQEDVLAAMPEGERATFVGQLWSDLPQMGTGTMAGIAGGAYGYTRGGPMGAFKYGTIAGGLGEAGGKFLQQQARRLYAPERVPPTLIGKAEEVGMAGFEGAVSEAIGHGATGLFRGAKRLIGGKVVHRLIHNADELNVIMRRHGSHLLPDQVSDDIILDKLGAISEKSFFGGPTIGAVKAYGQPAAIREAAEETAERFVSEAGEKLSQLEMGTVLLDTLTGGDAVVKKQTQAIYKTLREITGDVTVDLKPAMKAADELREIAQKSKGLGSASAIESLTDKVLQWDEAADFMTTHGIRSDLLDEGRKLQLLLGSKNPKLARAIGKIDDVLYDSMGKAAKGHSDETYNLWRQGANLVKETKAKFNDKLILGLVKKLDTSPDVAAAAIMKGGKKTVERVRNIVDKPTFNSLKYTLVQQIYTQAEEEATGVLRGQKFLSIFNKYERNGALAAAFKPDEIKSIRQIGELAFRTQMKQPGAGGGGMLVQLVQGGAIIQLASGELTGISPGSWTVLIAPLVYARMAANPHTAKWLTKGFGAKQGTKTAIAIGHRLIRIARKEQRKIDREKAHWPAPTMDVFKRLPSGRSGFPLKK